MHDILAHAVLTFEVERVLPSSSGEVQVMTGGADGRDGGEMLETGVGAPAPDSATPSPFLAFESWRNTLFHREYSGAGAFSSLDPFSGPDVILGPCAGEL